MNIARGIAIVTLLAFGSGCAETVMHPSTVASSRASTTESIVDVHELPPDSPGMAPIVSEASTWNHYDVDHPTKRGLSGGAVAGIVLGSAGGVALMGLLLVAAGAFGKSSSGGGGPSSIGHCCNWAGD